MVPIGDVDRRSKRQQDRVYLNAKTMPDRPKNLGNRNRPIDDGRSSPKVMPQRTGIEALIADIEGALSLEGEESELTDRKPVPGPISETSTMMGTRNGFNVAPAITVGNLSNRQSRIKPNTSSSLNRA